METNPATTVAATTTGRLVPRPAYASILEGRVDRLPEPKRTILLERVMAASPKTLEDIGRSLDLTRERIRQIEQRALAAVAPAPPARVPLDSSDDEQLQQALSLIDDLPLPVTEAAFVEAGFEPVDQPATMLLLELAARRERARVRPRVTTEFGRRWITTAGGSTPGVLMDQLVETIRSKGVVDDIFEVWGDIETEMREHCGSDTEAAAIVTTVMEALGPIEVGERWVLVDRCGAAEKARRIIIANGAPMTKEELLKYFAPEKRRSLDNAMARKDVFTLVERGRYGLVEFGLSPVPKLRDMIRAAVAEHGQVSVSYLQAEAERYGYSAASVNIYCGLPELIERDGILRRRMAADGPAVNTPEFDDDCLRLGAGIHHGLWSTIITIDHKRIYRGPQPIPRGIAGIVGLEIGDSKVHVRVNDTVVRASYGGHQPYLFGGELRPVLDGLGFHDGQRVRIVALGHKALMIESMPSTTTPRTAFETLVYEAGLYDENGGALPDDQVEAALAYAVGFDGPVPVLRAIALRLKDRHNAELLEALELIHPELVR